jgi:hypothetical protein
MRFDWLTWSNPVAIWWGFLVVVSMVNITLWLQLHRHLRNRSRADRRGVLSLEPLVLLSAAYVFGCAFRAVLPRADVQRICLFDTWLSNVLLGRSIATIAEVCFAIQWAIVLHHFARSARSGTTRTVATAIVPLILVAEGFSWYAVITTNYLGNAIENSLWTVTFLAIGIALLPLLSRYVGPARLAIAAALAGIISYVAFMCTVDVPMYLARWHADATTDKELLGFLAGLHDASARWAVTHDIAQWRDEIAWKTLYFSAAVWSSLALCGFVLVRDALPHYRVGPGSWRMARRTLSGRAVRHWLWPPIFTPSFTPGSAPARAPRPRARSPASR